MIDKKHGITITDPYRWLEDNSLPETRAWIEQQTAYTRKILDLMPEPEGIRQRLEEMIKHEMVSVPIAKNGYYYFTKQLVNENRAIICARKGLTGADEVLIGSVTATGDSSSYILMGISQDGKLLAYTISKPNEAGFTVAVFDIASRKDRPDKLPRGFYHLNATFLADASGFFPFQTGALFKPDNSGFYYSRFDQDGPAIFFHAMGTDAAADKSIFKKALGIGVPPDLFATISQDGRYLVIFLRYPERHEAYLQDTDGGPLTVLVDDLDEYFLGSVIDSTLFLWTTWQSPRGRIVAVNLKAPARENWRTIVPETTGVIAGFRLVGGKLAVNYLDKGSSLIRLFDTSGKASGEIAPPGVGTISILSGEWGSDETFFVYTSFTQLNTIYHYVLTTGEQTAWGRGKSATSVTEADIKQVWFESKDKTKVPMYVVTKKGLMPESERPALLMGYGGFGYCMTPSYSPLASYWVEKGGVLAVANVRGGAELGQQWHKAGKRDKKQNSIDDFIAAAEWLVNKRYTKPSMLSAAGFLNGGLLVTAAMVQRPDLFQAVVAYYPLSDMLRYEKLPGGQFWQHEYGSPGKEEDFKFLAAYSPYQNVKQGTKYPAVLFITGDGRSYVDPAHARKMTARLQAASSSGRPIALYYYTNLGFGNVSQTNQMINENAVMISFLFGQLGLSSKK